MIPNTTSCEHVDSGRDRRRLRERLFPPLSVAVACLLGLGTWQIGARTREYNSNRAVGGLIVAGMMAGNASSNPANAGLAEPGSAKVNPRTGLPLLSFPGIPTSLPAEQGGPMPALPVAQLTRATSYAEVVVYVWERIAYVVTGVLGLAGLIGVASRWVRGPHLLAATLLLLGTIATLVGMRLLVAANGGAFHPLPPQSYLIAGLGQSGYGLILLAALSRRPR